MNRQQILARLRAHELELRAQGVAHGALFGSRARDNATADSDTDIMIEIDPAAPVGIYEYIRIKEYIANLLEGQVDVVDREGLKPLSPSSRHGRCHVCILMETFLLRLKQK